jgi:hypothetical protein
MEERRIDEQPGPVSSSAQPVSLGAGLPRGREVTRATSVCQMDEARIEETAAGLVAKDDGWFILNLAEIAWESAPQGGTWCSFEPPESPSPRLGIGVHV